MSRRARSSSACCSLREHLLDLRAQLLLLRTLRLEQRLRLVAIALGGRQKLRDPRFARLDGAEDVREGEAIEGEEDEQEDHHRPEHQTGVDIEQSPLLGRGGSRQGRKKQHRERQRGAHRRVRQN